MTDTAEADRGNAGLPAGGAMRLLVAGAGGRMGRALAEAVRETDGAALAGGVDRPGSDAIGTLLLDDARSDDARAPVSDDPLQAVLTADGLLDFTAPDNTLALAEIAAQARIPHIIGTTGIDEAGVRAIRAAARHAPIVMSGNMSLGVTLLAGLARQAARALGPGWDAEVLEMHHRHKVDAPSGTALLLGRAAAEGRGQTLDDVAVMSREGHTGPRPEGAIGFAALRGGSVVGDHSVILAGPSERIVLSHHAESRAIFAQGAVRAALWARGRAPGLYEMADVLGLNG